MSTLSSGRGAPSPSPVLGGEGEKGREGEIVVGVPGLLVLLPCGGCSH